MDRNPFGGLTDREATLVMAALSRNNPILPIRAVDQKDLKAKFIITAWLLAEERRRPNFLAGALLKVNSVGGYIPNIQHLNWIVRNAYRTGSGNPDFRDNGGRVLEILWKMEWVIRKGGDFYDNKACFFIDYHNLGFVGVLVRVIEKWLNEEQDGNKTISDINQILNQTINKIQFEPHYPLSRFYRKADRLLVEQCGEAYDLLVAFPRGRRGL
ncbi:MAG: hypothetical protein N2385_14565, partial [Chloroflexus sp.]|nr:hypothetical protein [Chloroflexus sp.]